MTLEHYALPPLPGTVAIIQRANIAVASLPHVVATISKMLDVTTQSTVLHACRSIRSPELLLPRLRCIHARELRQDPPMHPVHHDWQATWGIHAAARRGDLDTVQFLATEYAPGKAVTEGVKAAVEGGHLHVLKWLCDEYAGDVVFRMREMRLATENGDLEMLQWLHERWRTITARFVKSEFRLPRVQLDPVFSSRVAPHEDILGVAASRGHLHVLKWVASEVDKWVRQQVLPTKFMVDWGSAATNGHLEVLKWLDATDYEWLVLEEVTEQVMDQVVYNGHFEVVQWFWARQPEVFSRWVYFDGAAACGRLDMLDWMLHVGGFQWSPRAIMYAASAGHLDVLRWLAEHSPRTRSVSYVMDQAAGNGHLDVIKFLHEQPFPMEIGMATCTTAAMDGAARNGHIEVVEWLSKNRSEGCTAAAMTGAASNGHLDTVKWLHRNRSEGCTTDAMDGAASAGCLDVVQWLHVHRSEGCTTAAMDGAASRGHLKVVQWLHAHRTEGCTTTAIDGASRNGHLVVVQWLIANRSEGYTSRALIGASKECHLRVVRWLLANRSDGCGIDAVAGAAKSEELEWLVFHHRNTMPLPYWRGGPTSFAADLDVMRWLQHNHPPDCALGTPGQLWRRTPRQALCPQAHQALRRGLFIAISDCSGWYCAGCMDNSPPSPPPRSVH